ncbi:MAG TPA: glycosyltransferase, partial [Defluviitaleaceae bacterium]|nr:glycosyltransferase [Defluviitaleaceae bacterium]
MVKKYKPDKVLSLQNTIIPKVKKAKQEVYIHQSLPFVEYKFRFKENTGLWIYQNIIGRMIIRSIKKADHVIVQTEWMKKA